MFDEQDPSTVLSGESGVAGGKNQRKLKNYVILRKFQLQQMAWVCIFMGAMALSYAGSFFIILQALVPAEIREMYLPNRVLLIPMIVTTLLFVLVGAVFSVVISHKVAGPMYRFKLVLGKLRSGDLMARLNLRPEDEFAEVAEDFNSLMDEVLTKKKEP